MCNGIQYYVEQSNKKVAAQVAAEAAEKAAKERDGSIIRAYQAGISVPKLSYIFELSLPEIEKILSSEESH